MAWMQQNTPFTELPFTLRQLKLNELSVQEITHFRTLAADARTYALYKEDIKTMLRRAQQAPSTANGGGGTSQGTGAGAGADADADALAYAYDGGASLADVLRRFALAGDGLLDKRAFTSAVCRFG